MAEEIQWDENVEWEQVSPEIQSAIQQPMSVEETLTQPKSMWESLTSPTQPEPFSVGNIAKDVAIGAGLGALYTGPTAGAGAVIGAGAGLAGGTLAELARSTGQAPLTQVVAGALGGEIPVVAKVSGKGVLKAFDWKKGRIAEEISDLTPKQSFEILKAKKDLYGEMNVNNLYSTEKSDILQNELREKFPELSIANTKRVSTALREKLYSDIKDIKSELTVERTKTPVRYDSFGLPIGGGEELTRVTPKAFINSPEYNQLMEVIKDLKARDMIQPSEVVSLRKILSEDLSTRQGVKENATEDIINLIQNGGVYTVSKKGAEAETKTKIPEEARVALKEQFDNYLLRNLGQKSYSELKAVEAAEFGALAEDTLNTLKQTNFKFKNSAQAEQVLTSLKNSPTGAESFKRAFTEYLGTLKDETAMKAAFNRMRPVMDDLGVLSRAQQEDIYKRVMEFEKTVAKNKKAQVTRDLITGALVGGQSPVTSQPINRPVQEILYPQRAPIGVFNM
jgi:hypothetical protein